MGIIKNNILVFRFIIMKKSSIFLLITFVTIFKINAQVEIEIKTLQPGKISSFQAYGLGNLSNEVPLSRINGSPFFNEDWQFATLLGNGKNESWFCKAKMNLVTNEIHYLDNAENDLVIESGVVKKLILRDNIDTSKILATFEYHTEPPIIPTDKKGLYVQILNKGPYQLLKYDKRTLTSKDSLFGTQKKYLFADRLYYFVSHMQKPEPIKKLNQDLVLTFLPSSLSYKEWISKNKINLKNEDDVITFLNYYNQQQPIATL